MEPMMLKTVAASVVVVVVMVLATLGKVDGASALDAIKWVAVTFLGGASVIGGARAFSQPKNPTPPTTSTVATIKKVS